MRQAKDAGKLAKNFEIPRALSRQPARTHRGCIKARARGRPVADLSVRQRFYRGRTAADSRRCRYCRTRSGRHGGWRACCGRVLPARRMHSMPNAWQGLDSTSLRRGPNAFTARWSAQHWQEAGRGSVATSGTVILRRRVSAVSKDGCKHNVEQHPSRRTEAGAHLGMTLKLLREAERNPHRFLFTGLRFSMNAAMPSERSSSEKVE